MSFWLMEAATEKLSPLRHQCAWCPAILDGRGPILPGEDVSHGICEDCRHEQLRRL